MQTIKGVAAAVLTAVACTFAAVGTPAVAGPGGSIELLRGEESEVYVPSDYFTPSLDRLHLYLSPRPRWWTIVHPRGVVVYDAMGLWIEDPEYDAAASWAKGILPERLHQSDAGLIREQLERHGHGADDVKAVIMADYHVDDGTNAEVFPAAIHVVPEHLYRYVSDQDHLTEFGDLKTFPLLDDRRLAANDFRPEDVSPHYSTPHGHLPHEVHRAFDVFGDGSVVVYKPGWGALLVRLKQPDVPYTVILTPYQLDFER